MILGPHFPWAAEEESPGILVETLILDVVRYATSVIVMRLYESHTRPRESRLPIHTAVADITLSRLIGCVKLGCVARIYPSYEVLTIGIKATYARLSTWIRARAVEVGVEGVVI